VPRIYRKRLQRLADAAPKKVNPANVVSQLRNLRVRAHIIAQTLDAQIALIDQFHDDDTVSGDASPIP